MNRRRAFRTVCSGVRLLSLGADSNSLASRVSQALTAARHRQFGPSLWVASQAGVAGVMAPGQGIEMPLDAERRLP